MHEPNNTPEMLTSVPNDLEAAMIVSALAAHGVDATTSGSFTSGFQAEAPGEVQVLVRRSDLPQAREALAELEPAKSSVTTTAANSKLALGTLVKFSVIILLAIGILQSCF